MSGQSHSRLVGLLGAVSAAAAIGVFGIGCLVLVGWILDIAVLKSLSPDWVSMKASTAVAFVLTGIALWLSQAKRARFRPGRYVARGAASAVAAAGLLTLAEYASGWNLGIDQLLFTEPSGTVRTIYPGRMAPNTALNFLLIGLALILLDVQTRRGHRPAHYLIGLGGIVALVALLGYLYDASSLYSPSAAANPMSLPAVLAGLIAFIGLWLARPGPGLLSLLTGESAGSIMARRLLLPVLLVPVFLDLLLSAGAREGLYDEHLASGVHVVLQTAFFLCLGWMTAASLDRADSERRKAEATITGLASFPELNPNPIAELDLAGLVHYVNPGARRLFPDLAERGKEHPWLAGFESIGGPFQTGQSRSAVREVTVGGRFYQQMLHWVEQGQRLRIYGMDVTERKRAEEALQKANEVLEVRVANRTAALRETSRLLEAFFQHSFDCLVFLDKDFNFIRANEAYARACQRDASEFPGHNHFEFYPHEENEAIFREVVRTKTPYQAVAKPFTFPDHPEWGTTYWDWTLVPILDAAGEVEFLVFSLDDVTRRKQSERRDGFSKALLESFATKGTRKEYLDSVVEMIRGWCGCRCVGIRVVDRQGNIPYESYVGFCREFWEAENWLSLAKDACACVRVVAQAPEPQDVAVMTPGGSFRCDNAIQFVAGLSPEQQARYRGYCVRVGFASLAVIPIRYHGEVLGAIHLADQREGMVPAANIEFLESLSPLIGEAIHRFSVEEELRGAYSYTRGLIEASLDPLVTISPQGRITDVNRATEEVTGVARERLIGSDFSEYFTVPAKARAGYQQVLTGGQVVDYPLTIRHVSGKTTDVLYNAVVYRNDAGGLQGVFAAARDITERKRAEEELSKYRLHLEELVAQRTEELARSNQDLQQFAYVASHDLQEPLRVITGYLQLIEGRYKGKMDADADQFIYYAVDGAKRMQQLIADLLDYSRLGTRGQPFQPTDAEAVLANTLTGLQKMIEDSGAVITHDPLPKVTADETQLLRLLQNLIGNGIKFRSQRRPEIHVSARREDGRWLFSVRDNGIGIEKQYWDQVFVIFQRLHTRQKYSGTGIGLAICKKIVERHGGRIWLESTRGQGTTFYFTI